MTRDESRAVAFLAVLLFLATVARVVNRPDPVTITAPAVDVAALQAAGRSLRQESPRKALRPLYNPSTRPAGPLDLNRASASEIEALPGIGPAVAQRIIARRDSVGGFRSMEALDSVKGIGPALLAKLRPLVEVR